MERHYKASELIEKLTELIKEHGDLPVIADDPDTGWRMRIGIVHRAEDKGEEYPERFEIKTEYYGDPEGCLDT